MSRFGHSETGLFQSLVGRPAASSRQQQPKCGPRPSAEPRIVRRRRQSHAQAGGLATERIVTRTAHPDCGQAPAPSRAWCAAGTVARKLLKVIQERCPLLAGNL
jgi:hypothetical protein